MVRFSIPLVVEADTARRCAQAERLQIASARGAGWIGRSSRLIFIIRIGLITGWKSSRRAGIPPNGNPQKLLWATDAETLGKGHNPSKNPLSIKTMPTNATQHLVFSGFFTVYTLFRRAIDTAQPEQR